ncbi:MAG: protein-methionine-sulfoxide reductase catalytic subunit MsrP, partial [Chloroflexota bacterium]
MANQASYKSVPVRSSEITPEHLYRSRRQFLKQMGVLGAGALLAACAPGAQPTATPPAGAAAGQNSDELGDPLNTWEQITGYNNYYEFSTDKEDVAGLASGMKTAPWTIEVTGLVGKPQTFGIEDLLKRFDQEERIYRLRCVEAWAMVVPWTGFPLSALIKLLDPKPNAKYVRFVTVSRPNEMPGMKQAPYPWPYFDGLRMDEAM